MDGLYDCIVVLFCFALFVCLYSTMRARIFQYHLFLHGIEDFLKTQVLRSEVQIVV